jgi:hypothetical protein
MPRNGFFDSRANWPARIIPTIPLSPKPPVTRIPFASYLVVCVCVCVCVIKADRQEDSLRLLRDHIYMCVYIVLPAPIWQRFCGLLLSPHPPDTLLESILDQYKYYICKYIMMEIYNIHIYVSNMHHILNTYYIIYMHRQTHICRQSPSEPILFSHVSNHTQHT